MPVRGDEKIESEPITQDGVNDGDVTHSEGLHNAETKDDLAMADPVSEGAPDCSDVPEPAPKEEPCQGKMPVMGDEKIESEPVVPDGKPLKDLIHFWEKPSNHTAELPKPMELNQPIDTSMEAEEAKDQDPHLGGEGIVTDDHASGTPEVQQNLVPVSREMLHAEDTKDDWDELSDVDAQDVVEEPIETTTTIEPKTNAEETASMTRSKLKQLQDEFCEVYQFKSMNEYRNVKTCGLSDFKRPRALRGKYPSLDVWCTGKVAGISKGDNGDNKWLLKEENFKIWLEMLAEYRRVSGNNLRHKYRGK